VKKFRLKCLYSVPIYLVLGATIKKLENMLTKIEGRRVKFEFFTIDYLKKFIAEAMVGSEDSVALNDYTFDELALDYRAIYRQPIPIPFIFQGEWIKIAPGGTVLRSQAIITENDPHPTTIFGHPKLVETQKIYRCGYCNRLIDEFGSLLTGDAYELAMKRWKQHGDSLFITSVGVCCGRRSKRS
jgi:hypothetical protein